MALLAELEVLYALVQLQCGSYMKGSYNLRKAWKAYERLEQFCVSAEKHDDPKRSALADGVFKSHCLFGLGAFHFFISLVPRAFSWILSGLGFTGDRENGLLEL